MIEPTPSEPQRIETAALAAPRNQASEPRLLINDDGPASDLTQPIWAFVFPTAEPDVKVRSDRIGINLATAQVTIPPRKSPPPLSLRAAPR